MNLDSFLVRFVILILPGLAGYKTFKALLSTGSGKKQLKDWEDLFFIFLYSGLSYFLLNLIIVCINKISAELSITSKKIEPSMLNAFLSPNVELNFNEIFWAILIGCFLGCIFSTLVNKKIVLKFFQNIKVTKHYGDEDVWTYINNSETIDWVIVRDHKFDLVYYAYIRVFSDSEQIRELFLEDVDVYRNSDGEFLYHTDSIYICRDSFDLSIEITKTQEQSKEQNKKGGKNAKSKRRKQTKTFKRRPGKKGRSK